MTMAALPIIQILSNPLPARVEAMKLVDDPSMKNIKNMTGYLAVEIICVMSATRSIALLYVYSYGIHNDTNY